MYCIDGFSYLVCHPRRDQLTDRDYCMSTDYAPGSSFMISLYLRYRMSDTYRNQRYDISPFVVMQDHEQMCHQAKTSVNIALCGSGALSLVIDRCQRFWVIYQTQKTLSSDLSWSEIYYIISSHILTGIYVHCIYPSAEPKTAVKIVDS